MSALLPLHLHLPILLHPHLLNLLLLLLIALHAIPYHHHCQPLDESCTRTVMIVVNRMLALLSSSSTITTATAAPDETPQTKTKACFIPCTAYLAPLYDEINLSEFQQIILSTMIRLFVLLLSTGDV